MCIKFHCTSKGLVVLILIFVWISSLLISSRHAIGMLDDGMLTEGMLGVLVEWYEILPHDFERQDAPKQLATLWMFERYNSWSILLYHEHAFDLQHQISSNQTRCLPHMSSQYFMLQQPTLLQKTTITVQRNTSEVGIRDSAPENIDNPLTWSCTSIFTCSYFILLHIFWLSN